jgi:activator of the mannose operon (transcriptional antiterminator)
MTIVEQRKRKIIHILSNTREFVTADELSEALRLSTKSIYRIIKLINEDPSIDYMIISERGKGYRLNFDSQEKSKLEKIDFSNAMTPVERRNKVMENLLLISPRKMNIFDLYQSFYVSENVINNDEKIISEALTKFDLHVSRVNKMIGIEGTEKNIRRALQEYIQHTHNIRLDDLTITSEDFNRYDAEFVLRQLNLIEKHLGLVIPHPYNINLFSHLYILLSRFRKVGNSFNVDKLNEQEKQQMKDDPEIAMIAKEIIQNSEQFLNTKLPENEHYYMYQYLISSRMEKNLDEREKLSEAVIAISTSFIEKMAIRLQRSFDDKELYTKLARHIKPMINRLHNGIEIKNNLLEQIKLEYPELFFATNEIAKEICIEYQLPSLTEDEVGFVTLYFAQAIEENPQQIKVMIVCTTGIGTSELLKVKVHKKFRELNIVDVLPSRNVANALSQNPDVEMIISTVQLSVDSLIPVVVVSAMLTLEDQKRLETTIARIRHE